MEKKDSNYKRLRKLAEDYIRMHPADFHKMPNQDITSLIEELQTHEIELELQNAELRHSQLELSKASDKYSDLYDFAPGGYLSISENGQIVEANLKGSIMLGVERSHLIGMMFSKFIHKEDEDIFYFHRQKILNLRLDQSCNMRLKKKDGKTIFVTLGCILTNDKINNRRIIRVNFTDISERKNAEKKLSDIEIRWSSLTETSPDQILILDTNLNIRYANFATHGSTIEDILETPFYNYVSEESRQEIKELLSNILKTGIENSFETSYKTADGNIIYYESRVTAHRLPEDKTITGLTVSTRDISKRKLAEEELSNKTHQLRSLTNSYKNILEKERKSVSREIHDEFGQVLSALKMNLSAIETNIKKKRKEEFEEVLKELKESKEIIAKAVRNVRKMITNLRPEVLDIYGLIPSLQWFLDDFTSRSGIKTFFYSSMEELDFKEKGNIEIFRILQEVTNNTYKHSKASKLDVVIIKKDDYCNIVITDNGIGFDKNKIDLSKSFGLLCIEERVFSLNGTVKFNNKTDKGSEIIINLPLNDQDFIN